ncbi:MAG: response regulator [Candidatus Sumerlaeia bacterium]
MAEVKSKSDDSNPNEKDLCILIVDDEEDFALSLKELLTSQGYSVCVTNSKAEALETLQENCCDMALIDIRLGRENGTELIPIFRELNPEILCIMMTAYADTDSAIGALHQGASDYLRKPIEPEHLFALIRRAHRQIELERKSARAEAALKQSETRYRRLIEESQDGILICDKQGHIESANPSICNMLGKKAEELEGSSIHDIHHSKAQAEAERQFAMALQNQGSQFESVLVRNNGETFAVEISYSPIEVEDGLVMGIIRDISARKETEFHLARLAKAVEQAAEDIILTDSEGQIQYVNPAFEQITGYPLAEVIGKNPRLLQSGIHPPAFYESMWDKLTQGDVWTGVVVNRTKDGSLVEEEANIAPIYGNDHQVMGYVSVKRDVSQQRKLETQLRQAQKLEAIGTLAGGIAHDFNNILQAILGYADLVINAAEEDSTIAQCGSHIRQAGMRAAELVGQILTFSRQKEHERHPLMVQIILKEAIKFLRGTLPSTIEIRQDIQKETPCANVDATQIHQVIMNLCTNAFQAMRETGGVLSVSLRTTDIDADEAKMHMNVQPGEYLVLSVEDNGPGMSPEVQERIFEPFFTTREAGEGTGMGLATVHGIVQGHEGFINVSSTLGKGSRFEVYLPATKEAAAAPRETLPEAQLPRGKEHILFVDDEVTIVELAGTHLRRLGYTVTACTNSIEALTRFQENPDQYDIVITDMTMPNLTGIELAQAIKFIRKDTPIILCSGFSQQLEKQETESAGVSKCLAKPVSAGTLAREIRQVFADKKEK